MRVRYWLGGLVAAVAAYVGASAVAVGSKSVPGLVACVLETPMLAPACKLSLTHFRPTKDEAAQLNREAGAQYLALYPFPESGEALAHFKAAGVDIDAPDERLPTRWTALHLAALSPNAAAVKLLLNAGAQPAVRDTQGQTALDLAKGRKASTGDPQYDAVIAILQPLASR